MQSDPIIQIRNLSKEFEVKQPLLERVKPSSRKTLSALHDVTLDVFRGEALSVVGESGCGKSTLARVLMLLYHGYNGQIVFDGTDLATASRKWISQEYRNRIQMVFQDPYSCLNPRKTVYATLREVLDVHRIGNPGERDAKVDDLLARCGISSSLKNKYPGELSGGQCQRIGIARALMVSPDVLIADEPVSALDVSVQAQVINLLQDLREELHLTLIFISHDLSIVRFLSDRVAVMYLGELVELGTTDQVFDETLHPYTELLLSSAPRIEDGSKLDETDVETEGVTIGELPSAIDAPAGCRFHTRCPHATARCAEERPELHELADKHCVACHLVRRQKAN